MGYIIRYYEILRLGDCTQCKRSHAMKKIWTSPKIVGFKVEPPRKLMRKNVKPYSFKGASSNSAELIALQLEGKLGTSQKESFGSSFSRYPLVI